MAVSQFGGKYKVTPKIADPKKTPYQIKEENKARLIQTQNKYGSSPIQIPNSSWNRTTTQTPTQTTTSVTSENRVPVPDPNTVNQQQLLDFQNEMKYLLGQTTEGNKKWAEEQAKSYGDYFKSIFDLLKGSPQQTPPSGGTTMPPMGGGTMPPVMGSDSSVNPITGNMGSIMFIGAGLLIFTSVLGAFKKG